MWMILVLIYSLAKGGRDLIKKKALEKSTAIEVLLLYTAAAFILVLPETRTAFSASPRDISLAALKALILFIAYLCSFTAIKHLPISLYGVVDLTRMLFSILLGVFLLQEVLGVWQVVGILLVAAGILLMKAPGRTSELEKSPKSKLYVLLAFLQSFLNACSGVLDKVIMRTMDAGALQFWFLLFLTAFYALYAILTHAKIQWRSVLKNYWIWIISLLFVFSDRLLFLANGVEGSQVVIMTLLKRSGCIVTILGGRIFFREKNIGYKLLCAGVMLAGILLAILLPA